MELVTGGTRLLHCLAYSHWFPLDRIHNCSVCLEWPFFNNIWH